MTSIELAKRLANHVIFNKAQNGNFLPEGDTVRNCIFNDILLKHIENLVGGDPDIYGDILFTAYCFDHWNGNLPPKN